MKTVSKMLLVLFAWLTLFFTVTAYSMLIGFFFVVSSVILFIILAVRDSDERKDSKPRGSKVNRTLQREIKQYYRDFKN